MAEQTLIPRVAFKPYGDHVMVVTYVGDGKEQMSLAIGGGPTQDDARANALRFADALRSAVLALKDIHVAR